jgi:hypothetical protein
LRRTTPEGIVTPATGNIRYAWAVDSDASPYHGEWLATLRAFRFEVQTAIQGDIR